MKGLGKEQKDRPGGFPSISLIKLLVRELYPADFDDTGSWLNTQTGSGCKEEAKI